MAGGASPATSLGRNEPNSGAGAFVRHLLSKERTQFGARLLARYVVSTERTQFRARRFAPYVPWQERTRFRGRRLAVPARWRTWTRFGAGLFFAGKKVAPVGPSDGLIFRLDDLLNLPEGAVVRALLSQFLALQPGQQRVACVHVRQAAVFRQFPLPELRFDHSQTAQFPISANHPVHQKPF